MHYEGINDCVENAQRESLQPSLSFNFHLSTSDIHFFKSCGVKFIHSRGCFPKRFGTYASLACEVYQRSRSEPEKVKAHYTINIWNPPPPTSQVIPSVKSCSDAVRPG